MRPTVLVAAMLCSVVLSSLLSSTWAQVCGPTGNCPPSDCSCDCYCDDYGNPYCGGCGLGGGAVAGIIVGALVFVAILLCLLSLGHRHGGYGTRSGAIITNRTGHTTTGATTAAPTQAAVPVAATARHSRLCPSSTRSIRHTRASHTTLL